jgi:hypothetical protein
VNRGNLSVAKIKQLLPQQRRSILLLHHLQGIVAQVGAYLHALGASLTLGRIDENAENVNYPLALKRIMGLVALPEQWKAKEF